MNTDRPDSTTPLSRRTNGGEFWSPETGNTIRVICPNCNNCDKEQTYCTHRGVHNYSVGCRINCSCPNCVGEDDLRFYAVKIQWEAQLAAEKPTEGEKA